ncbi:MAG: YihY/virulence factor BrkB family protein [Flavobacteriaceae bacterium]|jgi:membrane protein|nr:YihY/virulence factor BrkB family protein [Flavobacteriaceae bacterium]
MAKFMIVFFKLLKDVFIHFFKSNTFQKGAALAYFAVFSFIPMIVIIISLLGLFFGEDAISGEVYLKLKGFLGSEASLQVQKLIKVQHINHDSILTTIVGFVVLFFTASRMFNQIHNSLNSIWDIKSKPKNGILYFVIKNVSSILLIIVLFFLIFISTSTTSFIHKFTGDIYYIKKFSFVYEHLITYLSISLMYAIMYAFFTDAKVYWKAALLGGLFTSVLFLIGKAGIVMYIGNTNFDSAFGSASVLALFMVWVFYIAQSIFLGASFVKVYSDYLGVEIKPNSDAVKVEEIEVNN